MTVVIDFYGRWHKFVVRSAETGHILHTTAGGFDFPAAFTTLDLAEEWAEDRGYRIA